MPTPFSGVVFTFTNRDGSEIQARGWGNQNYAVFEALDGFTIIRDPESGNYCYADLSEDKNRLVPTAARVGIDDPREAKLAPHIRIRREAAKEQALAARTRDPQQRRWEIRRTEKKQARREQPSEGGPQSAPPATATVGTYVGLCVLVEFPDVHGTISRQNVDDYCNKIGFSDFGNNGSVYDYFLDTSDGKLKYNNIVTEYYEAKHNRAYYTDESIEQGIRARELILEVLNHLVSQKFNFNDLSSDSGGFIYALNIFYAGNIVNNWAEGLWPHSWSLETPFTAAPGKTFYDYQMTNIGDQLTLGTFCHENGHLICDFPDLYDYGYESKGVGDYCLMASGGNPKNPVHVCAYLKNEAGWATKVTSFTPGTTVRIDAGTNDFYTFSKNSHEYFIIENRHKSGRDASLPDSGLAIWHVDEKGSNNHEHMTPALHYECSLEQADGRFDLEHDANAGDPEDLFGAPYADRFDMTTGPSSNWWDGSTSGLAIKNISSPGKTMTFS